MTRIFMPIIIIAALYFAPLVTAVSEDAVRGVGKSSISGDYYAADTVKCAIEDRKFSVSGECEPKDGMLGTAIVLAMGASAVAAVLGIIGLLPFVGRLVSVVTTLAGIISIVAIGYFALNMMGREGVEIAYGSYVAAGAALLTLIAGLSGMRGR